MSESNPDKLSSSFIIELIKGCLENEQLLELCVDHIKYHYLATEVQKKIFKYIFEYFKLNQKSPTVGIISQAFIGDRLEKEINSLLVQIRDINLRKIQYEGLIGELELFIRTAKLTHLFDKVVELHNEEKKREATDLLAVESQKINEFSLRKAHNQYKKIFSQFDARHLERKAKGAEERILQEKMTFGIHEADDLTRGGFERGTSVLILAPSGVGKSTYLRWTGMCNARLGLRVVHFSAEGKDEHLALDYDAGWTGQAKRYIEEGYISDDKIDSIQKAKNIILSRGGEIIYYATESFDDFFIEDANKILTEIVKREGHIDLVIFDYLELFTVRGSYIGEAGERRRREKVANKMTAIATTFNCGVVTATQAADLKPEDKNNPEKVLTRHHISEFKGALKPFSVFATFNQTDEEYEQQIIRIHFDKMRHHKRGKTIRIFQDLDCSRFYNSQKTIGVFYDPQRS